MSRRSHNTNIFRPGGRVEEVAKWILIAAAAIGLVLVASFKRPGKAKRAEIEDVSVSQDSGEKPDAAVGTSLFRTTDWTRKVSTPAPDAGRDVGDR